MKIKHTLAALLLSAVATVGVCGMGPTSVQVGTVTLFLTGTSDSNTESTLSSTKTLDKYVSEYTVTTQKYGNTEFINELRDDGQFISGGKTSDYKLLYVTGLDSNDGIYALNTKTNTYTYLGGYNFDGPVAIALLSKDGHSQASKYIDTYVQIDNVNQTHSQKGQGVYSSNYDVFVSPYAQDGYFFNRYYYLNLHGIFTGQRASTFFQDYVHMTPPVYVETFGSSSLTSLVGDNHNGVIVTGSVNISALKPTTDEVVITKLNNAYSDWYNGDLRYNYFDGGYDRNFYDSPYYWYY